MRPDKRFLRIWLTLTVTNISAHLIAYLNTQVTLSPSNYALAFSSDALSAIIPAVIFWMFRGILGFMLYPLMLLWCMILAANIEFISEFLLNFNLDTIKLALSKDFLTASASSKVLLYNVLYLVIIASLTWMGTNRIKERALQLFSLAMAIAAVGLTATFRTIDYSWYNAHFLEEHLIYELSGDDAHITPNTKEAKRIFKSVFDKNLKAERTLPAQPNHNVLIITVEGLSQQHLNRGWTPNIKKMLSKGWHYTQVVNPNVGTANGIVSLSCGLPNLGHYSSKKLLNIVTKSTSQCLPAILNQHNYDTAFIQAAALSYQDKTNLTKAMGFKVAIGKQELPKGPYLTRWGLDDVLLYDNVKQYIQTIAHKNQPWFIQTMSISTHHPYAVPKRFGGRKKRIERAYRYADKAVHNLVTWLEKNHFLENTMVIITGDEARALDRRAPDGNYLGNNNGFMLIIAPNIGKKAIHTPVMQSDLAISILDYMGVAENTKIPGRSLFREYKDFRPMLFSNLFGKKLYTLLTPQFLIRYDLRSKKYLKIIVKGDNIFLNSKETNLMPTVNERAIIKAYDW